MAVVPPLPVSNHNALPSLKHPLSPTLLSNSLGLESILKQDHNGKQKRLQLDSMVSSNFLFPLHKETKKPKEKTEPPVTQPRQQPQPLVHPKGPLAMHATDPLQPHTAQHEPVKIKRIKKHILPLKRDLQGKAYSLKESKLSLADTGSPSKIKDKREVAAVQRKRRSEYAKWLKDQGRCLEKVRVTRPLPLPLPQQPPMPVVKTTPLSPPRSPPKTPPSPKPQLEEEDEDLGDCRNIWQIKRDACKVVAALFAPPKPQPAPLAAENRKRRGLTGNQSAVVT
eukprot:TRINITY_DN54423_c0_g2_i1.p1 TRINITY_DN54423_c0_g2~~TRINITY_DN54423_c0_g2_i1.p1  ORF type:complete len:281 (+),score=13.06 TRINITY_DN54423_c0_g2_i1:68-910(+)